MCGYTLQVHITKRANIDYRSILLKDNLQKHTAVNKCVLKVLYDKCYRKF